MRICIYGAGVIGGLLGAGISRAGHEVSLIARGPHLDAIRSGGLRIRSTAGIRTVPLKASANPADFGPQDLVIVATKTPALAGVAESIGPLLGPDTLVAFANNGVFWFYGDGFRPNGLTLDTTRLDPGGVLHRAVDLRRVLGMICYSGGAINEPGVIDSNNPGRYIVGAALPETTARAKDLFGVIGIQDFGMSVSDDIREVMWPKYVEVVGSQLIAALTGGTIGQNSHDPALRAVGLGLMREALAVAEKHGYRGFGEEILKNRDQISPSVHKPSTLQDLERGRPMEIDAQYRVLQDLAKQSGVPTPFLDTLVPVLVQRAKLVGCYEG